MSAQSPKETEDVAKKLAELEEVVAKIKGGYGEVGQYMEMLREISIRYFRIMELYAKHGSISVEMAVPEIKDPISKEIIKILLDKSEKENKVLNLSDITRELKLRRGTASRRIVREKVNELVKIGVVRKMESGKQSSYTISEDLINRWYSLLGLRKK
ncbi:MAG: ArsR family transcriptional regulator [Thermoplasmata archaeon]|nr:ArsR family transcriptional regulator [Thermoplasmata archaeon]